VKSYDNILGLVLAVLVAAYLIYALVAPEKNLIRPAGIWNSVTITARGNKIRVEMNGETAYAWNDPVTGAPRRMQSSSGSIDWSDPIVGPQEEELFEVPKGYQTMDMDEMRGMMGSASPLGALAGGMGGMGGISGMAKNQLAGMGMSAAQNFGGSLGSAAGASLGGPLGAMAGQYIGSKVAGWIAGKATHAIAPGPTGIEAPRKK
jgi:hypothetical protein